MVNQIDPNTPVKNPNIIVLSAITSYDPNPFLVNATTTFRYYCTSKIPGLRYFLLYALYRQRNCEYMGLQIYSQTVDVSFLQLLIALRMDKIVKERVNAEEVDGKLRKFNYYFINYRALLNVTKYKLDHMR
jgi:hypothetical protein